MVKRRLCRRGSFEWSPERCGAPAPRTARMAYHVHTKDLLEIHRKCDVEGYRLAVIYHSHCDAGPYFSTTDKRIALTNDEPTYPGVTYVVVSILNRRLPAWLTRRLPSRWLISGGRYSATAAFRWDAERRDFLAVEFKELQA